ncbi:MAG: PIN domain-containing protein [Candidatus Sulfotelmatobacter sp.]
MNLAADANVLLSALIGGRARLLLTHPQVREVFTTWHTFAEVEEYTPVLAKQKRLPSDILLLAMAALPVTIVDRAQYAKSIADATKRIGRRDPEDIELLALALHLQIPIWSNDRDFELLNVDLFTTEGLLRHLRVIE